MTDILFPARDRSREIDWQAGKITRVIEAAGISVATTLAQYQSWLTATPQVSQSSHAVQWELAPGKAGSAPLCVQWECLQSGGGLYVVPPSGAIGPSVYWPTANYLPGLTRLQGLFIEWSVAGNRQWQIVDLSYTGKLVIGEADWVRVTHIACSAAEVVPITYLSVPVRVTIRTAADGEYSRATVTHGIVKTGNNEGEIVIPHWLGSLVQSHSVSYAVQGTGVKYWGLKNVNLDMIALYGIDGIVATASASWAYYSASQCAKGGGVEIRLPAGTYYMALWGNNVTQYLHASWSADLRFVG